MALIERFTRWFELARLLILAGTTTLGMYDLPADRTLRIDGDFTAIGAGAGVEIKLGRHAGPQPVNVVDAAHRARTQVPPKALRVTLVRNDGARIQPTYGGRVAVSREAVHLVIAGSPLVRGGDRFTAIELWSSVELGEVEILGRNADL